MDTYFERFGGVRDYLRRVVDEARATGYTETIFGRRRYLPDLNSDNRQRREAAERMALNAPIQGTAADIVKIAMLQRGPGAARGGAALPDAAPGPRRNRPGDRPGRAGAGRGDAAPRDGAAPSSCGPRWTSRSASARTGSRRRTEPREAELGHGSRRARNRTTVPGPSSSGYVRSAADSSARDASAMDGTEAASGLVRRPPAPAQQPHPHPVQQQPGRQPRARAEAGRRDDVERVLDAPEVGVPAQRTGGRSPAPRSRPAARARPTARPGRATGTRRSGHRGRAGAPQPGERRTSRAPPAPPPNCRTARTGRAGSPRRSGRGGSNSVPHRLVMGERVPHHMRGRARVRPTARTTPGGGPERPPGPTAVRVREAWTRPRTAPGSSATSGSRSSQPDAPPAPRRSGRPR